VDEERPEPWVETLSWKPRVQVMHNLLTAKECEEIIALGEPKLTKSQVVGDNGENIESSVRTSHGLFFNEDFMKDSPLLRSVEYRIAKWTQIPKENGESFYLLRYELGIIYYLFI
jgi:prolyl 4-hydroxylase